MKNLIFLFVLFVITACNNNKVVYWCGDHPCINKKEKEAYFEKTMIVEVKELSEVKNKKNEIEKIMKEARTDEKNRIIKEKDIVKQAKLDEKRRIKEEKDLAKQLKLDEKKRIKEEKDLAKQLKLDEKRRIKEEKDLAKQAKKDEKKIPQSKAKHQNTNIDIDLRNSTIDSTKFSELVETIVERNIFRPYPDINDIPN